MPQAVRSSVPLKVARLAALTGCVVAVSVCGEQGRFGGGPVGPGGDTTPPVVRVDRPGGAADTVVEITDSLKFTVVATDNTRLDTLHVEALGVSPFSFTSVFDTTFKTTTTTAFSKAFTVALPANAAGQHITVTASALDGAGNPATAGITVLINDEQPPAITMSSPASGAIIGAGDTLKVIARAVDPSGIRFMGGRFFVRGTLNQPVTIAADSEVYATRVGTKTDTFNVVVPDTLKPGEYLVHAFAMDSSIGRNDTTSTDVTIAVRDVQDPFGAFLNPPADSQVVAGDSLRVVFRAQDRTGLDSVIFRGYRVRGDSSLGTDTLVLRYQAKRAALSTQPDSVVLTRYLNAVLTDSTAETSVYLEATLYDVGGNSATVLRRIEIVAGPFVSVTAPTAGSRLPVGVPVSVTISGRDPDSLTYLGFRATGVAVGADSLAISPRAVTSTTTLSLSVAPTTALGNDTIVPFARDRLGNRFLGQAVAISFADTVRPTVAISVPSVADTQVTAGDSVLIRMRVRDNRGVSSVTLEGRSRRGVDSLGTGVTVTRFAPKTVSLSQHVDTTFSRYLLAVATDSTAEYVYLVVQAQDSAGNTKSDSVRILVTAGPFVRVTAPSAGSRKPVGVPVSVTVSGFDPDSLTYVGFQATGVAADSDSVAVSPRATSSTQTLSLAVSATAALGPDTIVPFARDRLGNRFLGQAVVISLADTVKPTVTVQAPVDTLPVTVGDSVLVTFRAQDNRGVLLVSLSAVARRGSVALGTDTTVTRYSPRSVTLPQSTDTTVSRYLRAIATDSTSEVVRVIAQAEDSSGNSAADTALIRIVSGPVMTLVRPTSGAVTSVGKSVTIEVRAIDANGVRILGWRATGVLTGQDSVIRPPVSGALPDTSTFTDTLAIPALTPLGTITIAPFGVDSLGDPSGTVAAATITVQSAAGDVTAPTISFSVAARVEVDDSIAVTATDPSGITRVGWIVRALGATTVVRGDSTVPDLSGNLSDVTRGFQLNLDTISTFSRQVTVEAFAVDSVGNRGVSAAETLTVVAGKTIALPTGGQIADAIYNRNRNELYLSNITRNQIEVFQLSDSTFASAIPVGSRPWGLALWPRDTLGANGDSLVVALSGTTYLSIVDVAGRLERRRHRLPNYLVQTVKTAANDGGGTDIIITEYDLSDRPQYVATVCDTVVAGACPQVQGLYSTVPTAAQPTPFPDRGYLAWEELTASPSSPRGHLIFEHALSGAGDTLQVLAQRDTVPGQLRRDTVLGAGVGSLVVLADLGFQDTTFVRNSGDFNHVLIGEGGTDQGFARALTFDARAGVLDSTNATCGALVGTPLSCIGHFDRGISDAIFVRDFLINRAAPVRSIAVNKNARTALVRADSVYLFDLTLRLAGLLDVGGANPGMDFDPDHDFDAAIRGTGGLGGTGSPNDRLVFTARPDANVDVFDTFFHQRVATIPIRDPLIGPVRVAKSASGQQLLVGVTENGVVVVRLPSVTNPFPAPRPVAAGGAR